VIIIKRYKKGIETRNNIINASKSLFYLQGLNATTVQKVADLASVNLGLLSYYFKTKNNIINIIFEDFFDKVYEIVDLQAENANDVILIHMVKERIIYDILFKDSNNFRFFKEVIDKNIVLKLFEERTYNNYCKINLENNYNVGDNLIKCYSSLECGGRLNLLKNYVEDTLQVEYDDLIKILICCTPRLFGVDNKTITEYIDSSLKIQNEIDYKKVKLLI
jgi:AcrR family transcriptional regulator